ncbi:hypothetical protein EVAR_88875_1 [Eumeta japonica]|uniref:Uncharacterized protein n=1 Tax=Eumeta variegata TaxID=151549 RepID=A0A4C1XXI0_EUMVA|nr:hypothetical protein EVAR_88875_1 [Eumeta japonica]
MLQHIESASLSGYRQTTSCVESSTASEERFSGFNHELDVPAWDDHPTRWTNDLVWLPHVNFGYQRGSGHYVVEV